jgi:hypothetical protein
MHVLFFCPDQISLINCLVAFDKNKIKNKIDGCLSAKVMLLQVIQREEYLSNKTILVLEKLVCI